MKKYIAIGIGGFLGSISRVAVRNLHILSGGSIFPLNTLIINVTGAFVLSLILTVAFEILEIDENIRLGIATGFLGAYTTFSTLCKEAGNLILGGNEIIGITYVVTSILLGLLASYLGIVTSREYIKKIVNRE